MKTKLPSNLACWVFTFRNPKEVDAFIERGSDRQHKEMRKCLRYLKIKDKELFKEINGSKILRKLREKI